MGGRVWTFCWHNVEGTWCSPGEDGARRLERQLTWLARHTHVLDLAEVVRRFQAGEDLPRRTTAVTFDDGYADNLRCAVPVLERLGLPATFFLVPGLLGREVEPWWEQVSQAVLTTRRTALTWNGTTTDLTHRPAVAAAVRASLKRLDRSARAAAVTDLLEQLGPGPDDPAALFLDWAGARELVGRGFAVGSHTWHHGLLARETAADQHADLARARAALQDGLQVPVDLLAYPNGTAVDYDASSVRAARAVGHVAACTTRRGSSTAATPAFELRRFTMTPRRGIAELAKVADPRPRLVG